MVVVILDGVGCDFCRRAVVWHHPFGSVDNCSAYG